MLPPVLTAKKDGFGIQAQVNANFVKAQFKAVKHAFIAAHHFNLDVLNVQTDIICSQTISVTCVQII
jgi:hypothetical protein